MFFDAKAALSKINTDTSTPATTATTATKSAKTPQLVANVADAAALPFQNTKNPNIAEFEERAAICEYDGGLPRADAEQLAAQSQGYENVISFRAAQRKPKENRRDSKPAQLGALKVTY